MALSTVASTEATTVGAADRPAIAGTVHADLGLLLLRLAFGLTMAVHGCQILTSWFSGYGISATGQSFAAQGYPAGKLMAVIAGSSELLGGLGLAFGLLTPLAAAAIIGTMINAIALKSSQGFLYPKGYEYELMLTLLAASVALIGPGRLALDRFVPGLKSYQLRYGAGAIVLAGVVSGFVLLIRH